MILSSIACCMLAAPSVHFFYFISLTPAYPYHFITRSLEPWTARLKASGSQNLVGWNGQGMWHEWWITEMRGEFWWRSLKEREARCKWEGNIKIDFKNKTGRRPLHLPGSGNRHVPGLCERGFWNVGWQVLRFCDIMNPRCCRPVAGRQHRGCIIPQAVTHSLVLLKMGKIIARNMLSWLELLINRYCCI